MDLGNCDRMAGVLSAVEREGGWAPLSSHVAPHVARSQQDGGSLVLLDNGAGTLDAYNLLYPHSPHHQEWRLQIFTDNFICAFNSFTGHGFRFAFICVAVSRSGSTRWWENYSLILKITL
jgi:hypothetical protein